MESLQMRPVFKVLGVCILALFVVGLIAALLEPAVKHDTTPASNTAATPKDDSPVELTASVHVLGGEIIFLENDDGFEWKDCRAIINAHGMFLSGGYDYEFSSLATKMNKTIPLTLFTDEDGKRFDPNTHSIKSLSITCQSPTGFRSFIGALSNPD